MFSRGDLGTNNRIHEYQSLKPTQAINLDSLKRDLVKRSKISKNSKNNTKFTFKIDIINDNNSSMNGIIDSPFSKKRKSGLEKKKSKRMNDQKSSIFPCTENSSNIKPSKTTKKIFLKLEIDNNKRSYLTDHKPNLEERFSKGSEVPIKSQQNLDFNFEKDGVMNSMAYFAKEKKEDCKVQ